MKNADLYRMACHLLASRKYPEYLGEICAAISRSDFPLDRFLQLCDRHQILPALCIALTKGNLLSLFPPEAVERLEVSARKNGQRNQMIVAEAEELSNGLKDMGIAPVFLNGTANLLDGLYQDPAERFIRNVSFLVREDEVLRAADQLQEMGYQPVSGLQGAVIRKHTLRFSHETAPAGVILHRLPVPAEFSRKFTPNRIFRNRKALETMTNGFIPDEYHRVVHNFIHFQLVQGGHQTSTASLRGLFDLWLLSQRADIWHHLSFMDEKRKAYAWFRFMERQFLPADPHKPVPVTTYDRKVTWYLNHPALHRARCFLTRSLDVNS